MSNNLRKVRFNIMVLPRIFFICSVLIALVLYWQHMAVLLEVRDFSFIIITSVESIEYNPTRQVLIEHYMVKWEDTGLGFRIIGFGSVFAIYLLFDFY